jgi:tripartite ATP-independent transporter DctP family solute receptor
MILKSVIGTVLFILAGLVTAFIIGFDMKPFQQTLPYDDEQKGLDKQIVIKFSHVVAENTPKGLAALHFKELVEKQTDYQVKIEVFPNGILYSDKEAIDALIDGDVLMIAPTFSKLSERFPKWQVLGLPFLFPDHEAVEAAFDGEIGQSLFDSLEEKNMKVMSIWNNGFKQMTSNKRPLSHPSDFNGQRFRIMRSDVLAEQFRMLGAKPKVIPFNRVYHGLETGVVDGQENTLSNIYSKKFYQVQNYLTISNHGYLGYAVIINKKFLESLPIDVQHVLNEAMHKTTKWQHRKAVTMNKNQFIKMKKNSDINIHMLTEEEKSEWIKALKPVYETFERVIGEKLMNKVHELKEYDQEP